MRTIFESALRSRKSCKGFGSSDWSYETCNDKTATRFEAQVWSSGTSRSLETWCQRLRRKLKNLSSSSSPPDPPVKGTFFVYVDIASTTMPTFRYSTALEKTTSSFRYIRQIKTSSEIKYDGETMAIHTMETEFCVRAGNSNHALVDWNDRWKKVRPRELESARWREETQLGMNWVMPIELVTLRSPLRMQRNLQGDAFWRRIKCLRCGILRK